jgi:hypothetical protein
MGVIITGFLILIAGVLASLIVSEMARNKYKKLHLEIHPDVALLKNSIWPKKIEYSGGNHELNKIVSTNNLASRIFGILTLVSFVLIIFIFRERGL